jgi:hypothetical protein
VVLLDHNGRFIFSFFFFFFNMGLELRAYTFITPPALFVLGIFKTRSLELFLP